MNEETKITPKKCHNLLNIIFLSYVFARRACEAREKKVLSSSLCSASFQTFCLTARAYLNTPKYGLFCSLLLGQQCWELLRPFVHS